MEAARVAGSAAIRVSLVIAAINLVASGQPATHLPECPASSAAFRPAPKPWDIANDPALDTLWHRLGIPSTLRPANEQGFAAGDFDMACQQDCRAEVVSTDRVLEGRGRDSIVRVCKYGSACRFLLLHEGVNRWGLVDYVDFDFFRYEPPTEVVAAEDRRWLVWSRSGGVGTGVSLTIADWFEVRCGRLRQVLSLPLRGYDIEAIPARYFSTRFRRFRSVKGREVLEFAYIVQFEDDEHHLLLWQEERTVQYSRATNNASFAFDSQGSHIPEDLVDKVFSFDSLHRKDFVDFTYERLRSIAANRADHRRNWLREFLAGEPLNAKTQTLQQTLDSSEGKQKKLQTR
ncbi:MAG: hypothetical protein H7039_20385 [Bryobacteraceae bacterium]|nr:hypothetical protein [Bryobacteraceae bacterium]